MRRPVSSKSCFGDLAARRRRPHPVGLRHCNQCSFRQGNRRQTNLALRQQVQRLGEVFGQGVGCVGPGGQRGHVPCRPRTPQRSCHDNILDLVRHGKGSQINLWKKVRRVKCTQCSNCSKTFAAIDLATEKGCRKRWPSVLPSSWWNGLGTEAGHIFLLISRRAAARSGSQTSPLCQQPSDLGSQSRRRGQKRSQPTGLPGGRGPGLAATPTRWPRKVWAANPGDDAFTHRRLLHTDAFTHRRFYTQALIQTNTHFYTQELLGTRALTL